MSVQTFQPGSWYQTTNEGQCAYIDHIDASGITGELDGKAAWWKKTGEAFSSSKQPSLRVPPLCVTPPPVRPIQVTVYATITFTVPTSALIAAETQVSQLLTPKDALSIQGLPEQMVPPFFDIDEIVADGTALEAVSRPLDACS